MVDKRTNLLFQVFCWMSRVLEFSRRTCWSAIWRLSPFCSFTVSVIFGCRRQFYGEGGVVGWFHFWWWRKEWCWESSNNKKAPSSFSLVHRWTFHGLLGMKAVFSSSLLSSSGCSKLNLLRNHLSRFRWMKNCCCIFSLRVSTCSGLAMNTLFCLSF